MFVSVFLNSKEKKRTQKRKHNKKTVLYALAIMLRDFQIKNTELYLNFLCNYTDCSKFNWFISFETWLICLIFVLFCFVLLFFHFLYV